MYFRGPFKLKSRTLVWRPLLYSIILYVPHRLLYPIVERTQNVLTSILPFLPPEIYTVPFHGVSTVQRLLHHSKSQREMHTSNTNCNRANACLFNILHNLLYGVF